MRRFNSMVTINGIAGWIDMIAFLSFTQGCRWQLEARTVWDPRTGALEYVGITWEYPA